MQKQDRSFPDHRDRDSYATGSTHPPKQHGGMIAVLLVSVILLGSLCSTLGILNIRLLRQLAAGDDTPETMQLFRTEQSASEPDAPLSDSEQITALALWGETVSEFDRRYYSLPRGFLVRDVRTGGNAYHAGIHGGDIILSIDGKTVSDRSTLEAALAACTRDSSVRVEFYRCRTGKRLSVLLVPEEDAE